MRKVIILLSSLLAPTFAIGDSNLVTDAPNLAEKAAVITANSSEKPSHLATKNKPFDLSGLGKKTPKVQVSNVSNSHSEEEIISDTIYNSATSGIGTRRNIELIKPDLANLALEENASKPVVNDEPSALAFIDEFLGIKPVKPWEKGTLAKKEMKPGGLVPEFDVFSEKVFAYKQGSVGGSGVGGGGCGCN